MTESQFSAWKSSLVTMRAGSTDRGTCVGIEVTAHLSNGDKVSVSASQIDDSDTTSTKVEWDIKSPNLQDGVVYMNDYPTETTTNPNATTTLTKGAKTQYAIPLENITYLQVDYVDRKITTHESSSTASTTEETAE